MNYIKYRWRLKQRSWSQYGEDLVLQQALGEIGIPMDKATYLDIGAYHPFHSSNTYRFYMFGSRGVLVEPNPLKEKIFLKERKGDVFISAGVGEGASQYYMMDKEQLNTFSKEEMEMAKDVWKAKLLEVKNINLLPINDIFASFLKDGVDILSIDAEGKDYDILKELDYEKYPVKLICSETLRYVDGLLRKRQDIFDLMESKGYMVYADTRANTIFIKKGLLK